ncbi:MAG TPA: CPBP family intramembrane glutamic endopeptidase [Rhizomicrobium sp.]|nr:CPBP family intramembrane glutamic endopeptidase [Rhizomicrobium sp.]
MNAILHFFAASPWYDLALAAFAAVAMPLMSVNAGRQLDKGRPDSLAPRYLFTIARGMLTALAVLAVWLFAHRDFAQLGLGIPIPLRGQIGFVVVGFALLFALYQYLQAGRMKPEGIEKARKAIGRVKIMPRSDAEFVLFFAVAVNAGIWEELLYRGFLIWYFAPLAGVWGAVAISTALFGLGHAYQGTRGILTTGFVGLLLGIGFALTWSLWWLMALHALADIMGGILTFRLRRHLAHSPTADVVG